MKTLKELLQNRFGVKTTNNEQPEVAQVAATVTKVLSYNPNRYAFVFVNTGLNNVYLAPSRDVAVGVGILLTANGGSVSMSYDVDFELVGMEWFAIGDGGVSNCYTNEVTGVQ